MKTYSQLFFTLLLIAGSLLYSCNSRTNTAENTTEGDNTGMNHSGGMAADGTATPMTDTVGQANMDMEALMTVMTVDMNEINAATEAQKRKLSKPVLDYAQMMITEHTTNMEKGRTLSQTMGTMPTDTAATVLTVKQKGMDLLATLKPLQGKAFEQAYIDGMVKDHQDALNMLDNQLIPAAKNEAVRNHLTETRGHVAMHLERAQQIKTNM
jgi:putative membrane protein